LFSETKVHIRSTNPNLGEESFLNKLVWLASSDFKDVSSVCGPGSFAPRSTTAMALTS
jgi:hypothetical protein